MIPEPLRNLSQGRPPYGFMVRPAGPGTYGAVGWSPKAKNFIAAHGKHDEAGAVLGLRITDRDVVVLDKGRHLMAAVIRPGGRPAVMTGGSHDALVAKAMRKRCYLAFILDPGRGVTRYNVQGLGAPGEPGGWRRGPAAVRGWLDRVLG